MSKLNISGKAVLLMTAVSLCVPAPAFAKKRKVPDVSQVQPMHSATAEQFIGADFEAGRPAVRRVRLSGDFFALRPAGGSDIPQSIKDAKVRIDFAGQQPTFDDLLLLLEERGLSIVLGWDDGSYGEDAGMQSTTSAVEGQGTSTASGQRQTQAQGDQTSNRGAAATVAESAEGRSTISQGDTVYDLRNRKLPFRRFEGTLGGLFRQIQRSMGVSLWWNEGVYVSPVGRYSVMLPQNKDLMQQVVGELRAKGARNVVASPQAGTVSFVAPGALAEETIRPYLLRLGRNASEVTMQVALVSVVMNEDSARGFDWSQFNFNFGTPPSTSTGTPTPGSGGIGVGGGAVPGVGTGTGSGLPQGGLFTLGKDSLRIFNPAANILGATRPLDITGAIRFLSKYGNTSVDQNVELRTLAGTAVNWRSGETIPYVAGISATQAGFVGTSTGLGGLGGAIGAAQTEKLETGLTLKLAPNYEAAGGLVTVAFNLELRELIEFVTLSAGNQLGSFTQPRTREQKLDDIVRIPVGETVVLGGLRRQLSTVDRNSPFGLWGIGQRNKRNETQTIFIILRPTVTIYEVAGLDNPIPSKANELEVGSDGGAWQSPGGEYRGTNMFGANVANQGPERRRSMAQPAHSSDD